MRNHSQWILIILIAITNSVHCQNIDSGLVAHWSFDNDSFNVVFDQSPNALHGTSTHVTYTNGPVNQAVQFNGSNSYIEILDSNNLAPVQIGSLSVGSISVWFKFLNVGGNMLPIFYFGESDHTFPHNSLIIEIGHAQNPLNRKLYFTIINEMFCFDSGFHLIENTWYHFVAVVSSAGNTGYLNGTELLNRNYNLGSNASYTDFFADVPSQKLLSIGYGRFGQQNPFFHFKGAIDDVRIYNRPLSLQEVQLLYSMGSTTQILKENAHKYNVEHYPDPASELTKIYYSVPEYGHVTITLFDIRGTMITTIENTQRIAGSYSVPLNTIELAKGMYFFTFRHNSFTKTVKMIKTD